MVQSTSLLSIIIAALTTIVLIGASVASDKNTSVSRHTSSNARYSAIQKTIIDTGLSEGIPDEVKEDMPKAQEEMRKYRLNAQKELDFLNELHLWDLKRQSQGKRGLTWEIGGSQNSKRLKVWILDPDCTDWKSTNKQEKHCDISTEKAKSKPPIVDKEYPGNLHENSGAILNDIESAAEMEESRLGPRSDWSSRTKRMAEAQYMEEKSRIEEMGKIKEDFMSREPASPPDVKDTGHYSSWSYHNEQTMEQNYEDSGLPDSEDELIKHMQEQVEQLKKGGHYMAAASLEEGIERIREMRQRIKHPR